MKLNYFNFKKFKDKILMTNDFGQYFFASPKDFKNIISRNISSDSELAKKLIDANMIYDNSDFEYSSLNRYGLRELKYHVNMSTALHIFVVTTACNMNCIYCQANNGKEYSNLFMNEEIAKRSVDIALQSPTRNLDFEFQGGEPLLNFKIIKYIVEYAESQKGDRVIRYNVVTNLTLLTDEILEFFKQYHFGISTSLDGNEIVHNQNRTYRDGTGTFEKVCSSISKIKANGLHVGAIQTTTKATLNHPEELIHTYVDLGFDSIFLRPLTPLGKALVNWENIGYTPEEFCEFYIKATNELIRINKSGYFIKEAHAAIFLQRIDGRFVNYMELRSPCGAGIGQLAYYSDGNIFTCDEGRMLYEMGQDTFCLGNVYETNFTQLINNGICRTVCASSMLETIPTCCDCVYQPYCGTCPVVNFALCNDVIEKQPHGYRCKIYSGILDYLFSMFLEDDIETNKVLESWSN